MRTHAVAVVLVGLFLVAADSPNRRAAGFEEKHLQGTWVATSVGGFSKTAAGEQVKDLKLTIQGDKLKAQYGDKTAEGTYKLNAVRIPHEIDVTITTGPADAQGKTYHGIYLLEGDALRIAFRDAGQERPIAFSPEPAAGVYDVSFKRFKP